MKKLATSNAFFALSLAVILSIFVSAPSSALGIMEGVNAAHGNGTPETLFGGSGIITTITNAMLFLVGALAVIMIIIGGIRYTVSGGNSSNVTAAKNTIVYAILGLIVAFLAFAIVNFVLGSISPGGSAGFTNT